MSSCHKCGASLAEGQRICPACGMDNSEAARPQSQDATETIEAAATEQGRAATTAQSESDTSVEERADTDDRKSSAARKSSEARKSSKEPKAGMSATTKALIAAGVVVLFAGALVVWQVKAGRTKAVNLTAEDMATIVDGFPPQARMQLASDEKTRKEFAKDVREMLSLAEAARAEGMADRPEVQRQMSLARSLVIGQNYLEEQRKKSP